VLLFAALLLAHAQCVLACAVNECRESSLPPCHRHHSSTSCNHDHFVSAQPPLVKLAIAAIGTAPAAVAAITLAPAGFAPQPALSPPPLDAVRLHSPLRI
jgi:hypothetical protein